MESSDKIKVYKGNGAKGYYYSIGKTGETRLVPKQDTASFELDLNKYEIVTAAEAKEIRARIRKEKESNSCSVEKISYEDVNVDEVFVRISVKSIKETAAKHDFILSTKAIDAYRNLLTSCDDLERSLSTHRKNHPNMNHIDFDTRMKKFVIGKKNITRVEELSEQLSGVSICE